MRNTEIKYQRHRTSLISYQFDVTTMMTPAFNHLVGLGFVYCAKKVSKLIDRPVVSLTYRRTNDDTSYLFFFLVISKFIWKAGLCCGKCIERENKYESNEAGLCVGEAIELFMLQVQEYLLCRLQGHIHNLLQGSKAERSEKSKRHLVCDRRKGKNDSPKKKESKF